MCSASYLDWRSGSGREGLTPVLSIIVSENEPLLSASPLEGRKNSRHLLFAYRLACLQG